MGDGQPFAGRSLHAGEDEAEVLADVLDDLVGGAIEWDIEQQCYQVCCPGKAHRAQSCSGHEAPSLSIIVGQ